MQEKHRRRCTVLPPSAAARTHPMNILKKLVFGAPLKTGVRRFRGGIGKSPKDFFFKRENRKKEQLHCSISLSRHHLTVQSGRDEMQSM